MSDRPDIVFGDEEGDDYIPPVENVINMDTFLSADRLAQIEHTANHQPSLIIQTMTRVVAEQMEENIVRLTRMLP